jgi:hypothetical protein
MHALVHHRAKYQAEAYVQSNMHAGGREMEFFILMISVPLFLILVLFLSMSVLANYPKHEQAKEGPAEVRGTGTTENEDHAIA